MIDLHLNADLDRRVVLDTTRMPWRPSPAPGVFRKRLHLDGPTEAGIVTSIVRYRTASAFPAHVHPDGEEVLVLAGTFADEHGRYPAGSYLINPDGTRHAPSVDEGCTLFVKLRQFPGAGRTQVAIREQELDWRPTGTDGVAEKMLYRQDGFPETVRLLRFAAGSGPYEVAAADGEESFVVAGAIADEAGAYRAGTWLRNPRGAWRRTSAQGAVVLQRTGWRTTR